MDSTPILLAIASQLPHLFTILIYARDVYLSSFAVKNRDVERAMVSNMTKREER